MMKSCSRCGRIHPYSYRCYEGRVGLSKKEEDKLRGTNAWTRKSLEIRSKAQGLCEVCRDEGVYTYDKLEVHHIIKIKDDSTLLLDNSNLICLCTQHHKLADMGKLDKDYLRKLATIREER